MKPKLIEEIYPLTIIATRYGNYFIIFNCDASNEHLQNIQELEDPTYDLEIYIKLNMPNIAFGIGKSLWDAYSKYQTDVDTNGSNNYHMELVELGKPTYIVYTRNSIRLDNYLDEIAFLLRKENYTGEVIFDLLKNNNREDRYYKANFNKKFNLASFVHVKNSKIDRRIVQSSHKFYNNHK